MQEELKSLTIGSLAKSASVNVETIRYYQRRGLLLQPERPFGGIRRYGLADIDRLKFVKAAQRLGFSLNEIMELLQLEDGTHCQDASALAESRLQDVRQKISRLLSIESVLSELVSRCHNSQENVSCPLISALHNDE